MIQRNAEGQATEGRRGGGGARSKAWNFYPYIEQRGNPYYPSFPDGTMAPRLPLKSGCHGFKRSDLYVYLHYFPGPSGKRHGSFRRCLVYRRILRLFHQHAVIGREVGEQEDGHTNGSNGLKRTETVSRIRDVRGKEKP